MNYISDELRKAYEKKDMSYEELEKSCKVSRSTIQRYVMGITKRIDVGKLSAICDVLDVDVHKLIGYDKNSPNLKVKKNFGELLKRAREENNLTQQQLADMMQIPISLLELYESGERIPAYSAASAWAISLGISADEYDPLFSRTPDQIENDQLDKEVINLLSRLSIGGKKQTIDYVQLLLMREEKK